MGLIGEERIMNARRIIRARDCAAAVSRADSMRIVGLRVSVALLALAVALGVLLAPIPASAVDTGASEMAKQTARNVVHVVTPGHGKIDVQQADCYTLPEDETRAVDLYIWARCLEINGTLDGDIIAGFQEGVINGTVTQDVNGLCETMTISGEVGDDVRFGCETFSVDGHIGGDLIVAAKSVNIGKSAVIDGDVIIASATATVNGHIGGRVRIATGFVDMGGTIDGNAEITTDGGMRISPDARIGGDLHYEGPSRVDIADGVVAGEFTYEKTEKEEVKVNVDWIKGAGLFFHFIGFLMALVAGSVIVALTRDHARRTAEIIRTKPLKSLGIGFVTFICMPIVLVIMLVLILPIPLMFVTAMAYGIALYIAKFYFSIWLGNLILRRGGRMDVSPIPSMLLGLLIVYIVTAIPFLGTLAGIVIIFFGLGALLQRKETRLDVAFESASATVSNGLPSEFTGTGSEE
jgi:cytoskeletal protein CcmA (bactofilin family)